MNTISCTILSHKKTPSCEGIVPCTVPRELYKEKNPKNYQANSTDCIVSEVCWSYFTSPAIRDDNETGMGCVGHSHPGPVRYFCYRTSYPYSVAPFIFSFFFSFFLFFNFLLLFLCL